MYPMYDGVPASLLRDLGGPALTRVLLFLVEGTWTYSFSSSVHLDLK